MLDAAAGAAGIAVHVRTAAMMLIANNIRTRAVDRDIGDPFIQPVVIGDQFLASNLFTHYTRDQNEPLRLGSLGFQHKREDEWGSESKCSEKQ